MSSQSGTEARSGGAEPATAKGRFTSPSLNALVLLVSVLVGLQIGLAPLQDNSFLTHLATGRLILDQGAVPSADPYSWSAYGHDWTVQSWLASVFYAGAEEIGGLRAIRILSTVLVMVLIWSLWRLTDVAQGVLGRTLAMVLPLAVGILMWTERPFMFGAVGLALVLLSADDRLDPRWLVPVMWVWSNTHGSFPFAPVVLVLLALGRAMDERERPVVELRCLAWTLVGTVLAVVGPLGTRVLTFPFQLLENQDAFSHIEEWKRLDPSTATGRVFLVQLAVAVIALLHVRRWRCVLPAVVFSLAALLSVRNALQASIVLTPVIATGLSGLGAVRGDHRPRLVAPLVHGLMVAAVFFGVSRLASPDAELDPYPQEALAWMSDEGLLGIESRVVARELVGNYIEYAYGPAEARVFIDDRVDMYPAEVRDAFVAILTAEGQEEALLSLDPTAVLWDKESSTGRWLDGSEDWKVVWEDDVWLVALPQG